MPANPGRRELLRGLGGTALLAGIPLASPARAAPLRTSARIVIVGNGLGGLAVANRLSRELDGASLTVIDAKRVITISQATPWWRLASGWWKRWLMTTPGSCR